MSNQPVNAGIAQRIGTYSDAMLVEPNARWLFVSGTPGLKSDDSVPEGWVRLRLEGAGGVN